MDGGKKKNKTQSQNQPQKINAVFEVTTVCGPLKQTIYWEN